MADRLVAINTAQPQGEQLPVEVRTELAEVAGDLTATVEAAVLPAATAAANTVTPGIAANYWENLAPQPIAGDTPGTARIQAGGVAGPEFPGAIGLVDGLADAGTAGKVVTKAETESDACAALGGTATGVGVFTAADAVAARDAIAAAGLVGDVLTQSGTPVSPEQVGAAPLGEKLVIPASELRPTGGAASHSHLHGCPVVAFTRTATRVIDSFTRADNAAAIGTADTGETWTVTGTWGISGNRLYNPSATNGNRATVTQPANDCDVSVRVPVLPGTGSVQILFRFTDTSNYVYLSAFANGTVQLSHAVAGVFTNLQTSSAGVVVGGEKLTIRGLGGALTALLNDIPILSGTTSLTTGTNAGVRNAGDTTGTFRFDDFSISNDERASGFIALPAHWETFDVACLYTTLASGSGNVVWEYSENPVNLSAGTSLGLALAGPVTSTALASGAVQRAYLGTDRSVPADNLVAFGLTRRNSNPADTYANSVGLLAVELTQAS
ncbi:MAG: hypothetical protein CMK98_13540 [Pseudomonas sp.]|nr:hypothetical protein [Pseudomonas sp.]